MTNEGDISDYQGVKIERLKNGTIKLYQPHLIKSILKDLGFEIDGRNPTKSKPTDNQNATDEPSTDTSEKSDISGSTQTSKREEPASGAFDSILWYDIGLVCATIMLLCMC